MEKCCVAEWGPLQALPWNFLLQTWAKEQDGSWQPLAILKLLQIRRPSPEYVAKEGAALLPEWGAVLPDKFLELFLFEGKGV